jgi:hypothetical protein
MAPPLGSGSGLYAFRYAPCSIARDSLEHERREFLSRWKLGASHNDGWGANAHSRGDLPHDDHELCAGRSCFLPNVGKIEHFTGRGFPNVMRAIRVLLEKQLGAFDRCFDCHGPIHSRLP